MLLHAVDALALSYFPAAHATHAEYPPWLYVPAGQALQAALPAADLYCPAAHGSQGPPCVPV
jgi:hypothetical protein